MTLAVVMAGLAVAMVLAIVLISWHIRRLPEDELGGYEAQSLGYGALLCAYVALAAAAIGGCVAVWDVLGRVVP